MWSSARWRCSAGNRSTPHSSSARSCIVTSPIARLIEFGQSPWYDNLTRALATGGLRDLVAEHGIRGVTSNPTIFEKAMASGTDYDAQLREVSAAGASTEDAYWDLVTT